MSKLVQDLEYVKTITYLDDLLMLTKRSFKYHLLELEMILARLSTANIRVNISKSKFFAEQIEYLVFGYWITRKGIQPIHDNVEIILNIKAPKTRKARQLRQFIGIVCSMLRGQSQFMIVIHFRLFLELDLVCQTGM
jgi:hypothetical protein